LKAQLFFKKIKTVVNNSNSATWCN